MGDGRGIPHEEGLSVSDGILEEFESLAVNHVCGICAFPVGDLIDVVLENHLCSVVPEVVGIIAVRESLAIIAEEFVHALELGVTRGTYRAESPFPEGSGSVSGSLEIIKKDAYEDIKLSGAGFRLYSSDGEQIEEGYTDRDGILSFESLPRGDYYYKEFKPPMGYLLDEAVYLFSIEENGETVIHTRDNLRREGTLQVKKQDSDGSALPGAAFLLEFSTDGGSTWAPVSARENDGNVTCGGCTSPGLTKGELVSDSGGIAVFTGLRADSKTLYRLTETKAPEGYSVVAGSLYVGTLPVEVDDPNTTDSEHFGEKTYTYTIYNTVTDCPMFRLPETGGSGFYYLPIIMLLTAAIILLTSKRRTTD